MYVFDGKNLISIFGIPYFPVLPFVVWLLALGLSADEALDLGTAKTLVPEAGNEN